MLVSMMWLPCAKQSCCWCHERALLSNVQPAPVFREVSVGMFTELTEGLPLSFRQSLAKDWPRSSSHILAEELPHSFRQILAQSAWYKTHRQMKRRTRNLIRRIVRAATSGQRQNSLTKIRKAFHYPQGVADLVRVLGRGIPQLDGVVKQRFRWYFLAMVANEI